MSWGTGQYDGKNTLMRVGLNEDVVTVEIQCYEKWRDSTSALIDPELLGCDAEEQCYSVFYYLANNVSYLEDPDGYQYIKSPARLLHDGVGDCKSMTMFVCCCLHALGIPHVIRFVNFDGGSQYTHVYPVAIVGGREVIMDVCELDEKKQPIYNYARSFAKKLDFRYER